MKVVTFGEILLRLTPEGNLRFVQADRFTAAYGGGEANTAVCLANFGADSVFVTKLPPHELGDAAENSLRRYGVDVSRIARGGERLGVCYSEKGADRRYGGTVYDRKGSAFASSLPSDYDWDAVFAGADWFHFTGDVPALNGTLASVCLTAAKKARARGVTVSCDIDRFSAGKDKDSLRMMSEICRCVDVCIVGGEGFGSAEVAGIPRSERGIMGREERISAAESLTKRFGFKIVAAAVPENVSANEVGWSAMLYAGGNAYFSRKYAVHAAERAGVGDSFGAGVVFAMLSGWNEQKIVEFAAAAGCLKYSVEGEYNLISAREALALADGDGNAGVRR